MSRLLTTLLAAALLLLVAVPALAADTTPGSLRIESADAGGHPEVEVQIVAPRPLAEAELEGGDFSLSEGGQPREVEATRLPGVEQEIVLAVDVSGSMRGEAMDAAKAAAGEFVTRAPDGVRVAVIAFASRPRVVAEFTSDRDALTRHIAGLEVSTNTALYDAVVKAADLLAGGEGTTKTLVVLSDGGDTASGHDIATARDRIAEAGASFFAIELETASTDRSALDRLVSGAGGMVVTASDPSGLAAVYDAVAVDIGNRYTLRYRSGEFGRTDLEVGVDAHGVEQRVDGYLLDLPRPPAWRRLLTSPLAVVGGLAACYAALAVMIFGVLAPRGARVSLAGRGRSGLVSTRTAGLTDRLTGMIDHLLGRRGWTAAIAAALEQAGLKLRPGDLVLLVAAGALAAAATGLLLAGPMLALLLVPAAPLGAKVMLGVLADRRQAAFADQLDDSLQLLSGSLRAGHSLLQAVDALSREADAPTSEEFTRLINETRLGRDLGGVLDLTAQRMGSQDFLWVSQAIAIHREVGGDLAEVLDTVGHTIRERNQIRRQVKALSAEGRLSAIVLMALPFGILVFLAVANPGYIAKFTESLVGYGLLAFGATLLTVGGLWLRKLVRFQF